MSQKQVDYMARKKRHESEEKRKIENHESYMRYIVQRIKTGEVDLSKSAQQVRMIKMVEFGFFIIIRVLWKE